MSSAAEEEGKGPHRAHSRGASGAGGGVEVGGDTFFDPLHAISRVPPELIRLTDLLRHSAWLATPGARLSLAQPSLA